MGAEGGKSVGVADWGLGEGLGGGMLDEERKERKKITYGDVQLTPRSGLVTSSDFIVRRENSANRFRHFPRTSLRQRERERENLVNSTYLKTCKVFVL